MFSFKIMNFYVFFSSLTFDDGNSWRRSLENILNLFHRKDQGFTLRTSLAALTAVLFGFESVLQRVRVEPSFASTFEELQMRKSVQKIVINEKLHDALTLLAKMVFSSFRTLASSRCFCSTLNFADVALSMSLDLESEKNVIKVTRTVIRLT